MPDIAHTRHLTPPTQRTRRGTRRDSGGAPRPKADPPLLTGGLQQRKSAILVPEGCSVDYLTVTVPPTTAEVLLHRTEHQEDGTATRGFQRSEQRQTMGGHCWRKFDPYVSSKDYGTDYETWEFAGVTARFPVQYLEGHPCRFRRVDVAFDYACPERFWPRHLERLLKPHTDATGILVDHRGPRDTRTVYYGSSKSERRIRTYRRDAKHPDLGRPIFRVELVLEKKHAIAWWEQRSASKSTGYAIAAQHIYDMIGIAPQGDLEAIEPCKVADPESSAAQTYFHFVHQNAVMLRACEAAGLDPFAAARAKFEKPSRYHTTRIAQKADLLAQIDADRLQCVVEQMLRKGNL